MDSGVEEIKLLEALKLAEAREEIERDIKLRNNERVKYLQELSWIKRLQEREFIEQLERLELNQKWAFEYVVKQYYTELKDNWEEEFNHFFTELLNEEVKSINDYMKKHNYRKEETESFIKS